MEAAYSSRLFRGCRHPGPQVAPEGQEGVWNEGRHRGGFREACLRVHQVRCRHRLDRRAHHCEPFPGAGDCRCPQGHRHPCPGEESGQSRHRSLDRCAGEAQPGRRPQAGRHPPRFLHRREDPLQERSGLETGCRTAHQMS